MGRDATRAQQAKARVREARLVLLTERQAQDERIEEATVHTILAWEDLMVARARLETAEHRVGDALAALAKEKVPVTHIVTLTGIGRPQCTRLLRFAVDQANPAAPESGRRVTWAGRSVVGGSR